MRIAKSIIVLLALFFLFTGGNIMADISGNTKEENGIKIEKIFFKNGEFKVAGNLYFPPKFDKKKKYAAIVAVHPFGGVKEQVSGLYSKKLAELGFVTLAYDASYWGDSSGKPRNKEVPTTRVEDISAAIDFLSNRQEIDPKRIGVLGTCSGGGYAISVAQTDHRVKAVATVSMFDVGSVRREGLGRTQSYEARMKILDEIGDQRTREARGEEVKYTLPGQAPKSPEDLAKVPALYREGADYYGSPRGFHPNANGKFVFTSLALQMAFFPFTQIETISPRPILMIAGEKADTRYFSQEALEKAKEPKELFIIPGATHIDLYDKPQFVGPAVIKLKEFFLKNL
ncbi:alpha/beta hydrolase family protein [Leptospira fainei serovar Hurstbridge str. BUT 6]|uniref:Alpha/beta hydrolase family protein n=1 Tax=Leptospira fainei serovar Hurstbridge str. BUT 6 TaxID=1193011 RepID=S3V1X3_9LEPT|nr:alpha/beta hydrolase [Leptospira fainei]EPG75413.1 alpha/beta hydrolase family protein [Leptospira fainei serovar Hurstbridge str. BUT 6]